MSTGDSKDAEKAYLARTGGGAWEREKPFSPPGTDMFDEGLDLLSDFVVALRLLQPAAGDRILDLGAGAGWCSDLLQRLNRRSVAVDISLDMLRVA
ncbi:MAG: class I SAM-dependent methyltransferase, partial [Vicinamibacterales bacterium]